MHPLTKGNRDRQLRPTSNLKTDHKKEPSEYTRETVVDKSKTFFDDLQNLTRNKTHKN